MKNINTLFSSEITEALGWTVLHSLWQSGVIAALLLLSFVAFKKASAKVRYRMAGSAMLGVLLSSIATFVYFFNIEKTKDVSVIIIENETEAITPILINITEKSSYFGFLSNYFEQHLPLIVAIWLVGMGFFLVRLLGGFAYVHYLKNNKVKAVTHYWQQKADALREKIPVKKSVAILESTLVKMPMTIGYLKPVILLPVGLINHLTIEQTEAVLAHELAHIARKDYLFNILQSIMEVLFYFNPAVWLISTHIRRERENCCDDIAIRVCGNSLNYVKALVNVEEVSQKLPQLAMTFSNNKNHLLMRVQRILKQPQKKSRLGERLIASLFITTTFAFFAFQQKEAPTTELIKQEKESSNINLTIMPSDESHEINPITTKSINSPPVDTIPKKQSNRVRMTTDENGRQTMIKTQNGEIEELIIKDREINPEDYGKYEKEIANLLKDVKRVAPPRRPSVKNSPTPPTPPTPPTSSDELREIKLMDENGTTSFREEEKKKEMKKRMEADRKKRAAELEKRVENLKKESKNQREETRKKAEQHRKKMQMDREKIRNRAHSSTSEESRAKQKERIEKMKEDALLRREGLEKSAEQRRALVEQRKAALRQEAESQRQVIHAEQANDKTAQIEEELQKDGLYNKGVFKFKLTNKELKINGKKQSKEMYKKYKKICAKSYEGVAKDYSFEIQRSKNGNKQSIITGKRKEE